MSSIGNWEKGQTKSNYTTLGQSGTANPLLDLAYQGSDYMNKANAYSNYLFGGKDWLGAFSDQSVPMRTGAGQQGGTGQGPGHQVGPGGEPVVLPGHPVPVSRAPSPNPAYGLASAGGAGNYGTFGNVGEVGPENFMVGSQAGGSSGFAEIDAYKAAALKRYGNNPQMLANIQSGMPSRSGLMSMPGATPEEKANYALDYLEAGSKQGLSAYDMISRGHDPGLRGAVPVSAPGAAPLKDPREAARRRFGQPPPPSTGNPVA